MNWLGRRVIAYRCFQPLTARIAQTSTLQKELLDAGAAGYELVGMSDTTLIIW